jgi:hypothetical protein
MTTINLEKLSKQLNCQKLAIIELARKGEIIFNHANLVAFIVARI